MLGDRDYMKMREAPLRSGPKRQSSGGISFVFAIIIANVAVYLIQTQTMLEKYDLKSIAVIQDHQYFRMVSSMFLHGSFAHILFNMWGLYMFGTAVERQIGKWKFAALYFTSGIVGSVIWILSNWSSSVGCIGASGAVSGIAVAAMMLFPDVRVMLIFPPIPMKLKTFVMVFLMAEVFFELTKSDAGYNIAHIVHLGGALGGYIYMIFACTRDVKWGMFAQFGGGHGGHFAPRPPPSGWDFKDSGSPSGEKVTQRELDRLLDKISIEGINSLSEEELDTLRRAREQMKGR